MQLSKKTQIQLSKRLQAIASYVPKGSKIADIGTDHGYLPIYLRLNDIATTCIACDINKGPLENALKHIRKYNVLGITLRQGNGLEPIHLADQVEVISIAGMGGYLIKDILENNLQVVKAAKRLILQPQNNLTEIRELLHRLGFCIEAESFVEEEGKYYNILSAVHGNESYSKPYEYVYGLSNLKNPSELFKQWMKIKEKNFVEILEHLKTVDTKQAQIRKKEVEQEYTLHKEAMACIF